jgi:hypothetical protein
VPIFLGLYEIDGHQSIAITLAMDIPETKEEGGPTTTQQLVEDVDAGIVEKPARGDVDDAHELFHGQPESFVYSAKEANRVRMKLDCILLPMVCQLPSLVKQAY